ncbi:MAG: hypothetical protein AB1635_05880 [Acidobacteriota bacterium]
MAASPDPVREYLRHTVATLAYRGGKAVRGVSDDVAAHVLGDRTRTPLAILAHINDLLDWAMQLCEGRHVWKASTPGTWADEVARFHRGLAAFDARLAAPEPLGFPPEQLFQGPVADALTHVGQIALIRRLAGSPVKAENYFKARIERGRVGAEQAAAAFEFD